MFKAEISNSSLEEILECSVPMYKFVIADKRKIRTVGIKLFRLLIVCRKHPINIIFYSVATRTINPGITSRSKTS